MAYWIGFVTRALHTAQLGTGTNSKLLGALEQNSSKLSDISQEFVERGAELQIRTFYETEKLSYMNSLVISFPPLASAELRIFLGRYVRVGSSEPSE